MTPGLRASQSELRFPYFSGDLSIFLYDHLCWTELKSDGSSPSKITEITCILFDYNDFSSRPQNLKKPTYKSVADRWPRTSGGGPGRLQTCKIFRGAGFLFHKHFSGEIRQLRLALGSGVVSRATENHLQIAATGEVGARLELGFNPANCWWWPLC